MSTIHLWDNSWHVSPPNKKWRDSFGRPACDLKKNDNDCHALKILSSNSIDELMKLEGDSVLIWPYSFKEGYEELKGKYIINITEKDGNKIDTVTTNNIIGFVGIKHGNVKTDIRIHSRFSSKTFEKKGESNDSFLYYMLEKVMAINMFSLTSSADSKAPQVFDFLLFFFPKLLKEAMSQGMFKKYVYREYNDANVRGVIDINRHIRRNIPANGKIAYRTREFSYDNPMTQLIRHTIEFMRRKPFGKAVLHNDAETESCVQQIIQATPTFVPQKRQAVINENLRPVAHPYYTKYAALQKLCLRILQHEKLSYGSANDNKIHGLLIDAAWLWEEYVAKVLSERDSGLKHYTRSNSFNLLQTSSVKKFQPIIPDYYDDEKHIVADAKYIPLHRYDHLDADRAIAIYYKTIMYMYRFNTQKGFLFHPCSQDDLKVINENRDKYGHLKVEDNIVFCDYQIEDRDDCHLYEIGMVIEDKSETENNQNEDNKYDKFKGKMVKVEEAFCKKIKSLI